MNREESMTLMMLPNDLILNCIARVPRLYYHTLSLVSSRFRSLLASTELYQTRILLGCTESCLYVCLRFHTSKQQRWFSLCGRPNSSKNVLVPITSPNSPSTYQSDNARVGSDIYAIGGFTKDNNASSRVMVMDCRSHTWREAPSMRVARESPSVCVLDGKIYVTGGCKNLDATNWMEVFDTMHQTWEFESSSPGQKIRSGIRYQSVGYDGSVYVKCIERLVVTYKLNKGRWRAGG
ncbi:PREDICTED: F-box/kelch-repeat protein At4g23580-like [Camelina sativa]|uniref:F-box/kelch-repeat protein At4g23580-like n=1 Tax=Camelina sativa TaxID=90675 RepID=A0ABM0XS43_CAMSA|nr:PREDICTED: F-box/kelch-repeat protein At4g23580-like [Camelina sativa]